MLPITPDTVYLSVVDGEGNAVSFINSLYTSFGSGIVARGTGIALQNRGNLFVLDPDHPNCIAPHKRPYHTIIPCMVTREDRLALCFGVMGGYMQPQGHVQVLTNIIDHGMNPQQALDAPRFMYQQGREYIIENSYDAAAYPDLEARGHILKESESLFFGGGQVIMVDPESGALMAGSEPRNDGCAVAY
jgi:gamma-glutamyltranspeptidase/glutathione hydrolase